MWENLIGTFCIVNQNVEEISYKVEKNLIGTFCIVNSRNSM